MLLLVVYFPVTLKSVILKTDLWPVQTDLEIFRPIYFASNVILSVRKMYILVPFVIKFVETITVVVFFFMIGPIIHTF